MNQDYVSCKKCACQFQVTSDDQAYYAKIGVQTPIMCPQCRAQLRLAHRNERSFYRRACDRCGETKVSTYSPNKPYDVWCYECWAKDDWNPEDYAMDYDESRPFFDQLQDLMNDMPRPGTIHTNSINSQYMHLAADHKNCYMVIESSNNEDCIHCFWIQQSNQCVDSSFTSKTELCYEIDNCYTSYGLRYCNGCHDCRSSYFLYDCRGCSDCIGCMGLRNKQYYVFNQFVGKEKYRELLEQMRLDTHGGVEALRQHFQEFFFSRPIKYADIVNSYDCTGNFIKNAKNCTDVFHCYDAEDNKYSVHVWRNAKDCFDCDTAGRDAERCYNTINAGMQVADQIACNACWSSTFTCYSRYCMSSNNCFGCIGLRQKNYCILNKQYSKEEYEAITAKIIAELKSNNQYGEFFPIELSDFGYNESDAMIDFPLERDAAEAAGFAWEETPRGTYGKGTIDWENVPDSINDTDESIINEIFTCGTCEKNYRVIHSEYLFYSQLQIPIPRRCPDCRHQFRMDSRGPNQLWQRSCDCGGHTSKSQTYQNVLEHFHAADICPNEFLTNISPERPEIVYCEPCYLDEILS